jgi:hypothetical protein
MKSTDMNADTDADKKNINTELKLTVMFFLRIQRNRNEIIDINKNIFLFIKPFKKIPDMMKTEINNLSADKDLIFSIIY